MFAKIKCGYCNQSWEIYERDDLTSDKTRRCPHCGSKIDADIWKELVIPTFKSAVLLNWAMMNDHVENHHPLFTASFIADHIFPVSNESADEIRKVVEKYENEC